MPNYKMFSLCSLIVSKASRYTTDIKPLVQLLLVMTRNNEKLSEKKAKHETDFLI